MSRTRDLARDLTTADLSAAAKALGCELAAIQAVDSVESRGHGFLPDGRPKILFEGHVFWRCLARRGVGDLARHAQEVPAGILLDHASASFYLGGAREYDRLAAAVALSKRLTGRPDAAHEAASWGRYQILGENFREAGFPDVEPFVDAMCVSEREHLAAFVAYVRTRKLDGALRTRDWPAFAAAYNGPRYKDNHYDEKLVAAYAASKQP